MMNLFPKWKSLHNLPDLFWVQKDNHYPKGKKLEILSYPISHDSLCNAFASFVTKYKFLMSCLNIYVFSLIFCNLFFKDVVDYGTGG